MNGWTYLEPVGEAKRGSIRGLVITNLGAKRFVTAVRTANGKLKIFSWGLNGDGSIKFLDSYQAEEAESLAVAALDLYRFVTLDRTKKGKLNLIVWNTDEKGKISKLANYNTSSDNELKGITFKGKPALTTLSDNLLVSAVLDNKNFLNLITLKVYIDGSYRTTVERRYYMFEDNLVVKKFATAAYDAYPQGLGNLATPVITKMGEGKNAYLGLKVINWRIRIDGRIDRLGDLIWGTADDVVATSLSHKRIVTAIQSADGYVILNTWDFDSQGNVSMREFKGVEGGKLWNPSIAALSGARVIISGKDRFGKLRIIVWDAINNMIQLGEMQGEPIKQSLILPLGSDWIVTPVVNAEENLGIYLWKEHAIPLLTSEWMPPNVKLTVSSKFPLELEDDLDLRLQEREEPEVNALKNLPSEGKEADSPSKTEPLPFNKFHPQINGVDPMVAAGFKYLIVSQQGVIAFFDKKGNKLLDAEGNWKYSIGNFFSSFLNPQLPDGSPNQHCINRHAQFPLYGPYNYPPAFRSCDPDFMAKPPGLIEFYDTRVHFDPISRRFFIFAFTRPKKFVNMKTGQTTNDEDTDGIIQNKKDNMFNRRYWAFAVSKTENPRNGFYQWMSTEPYVADAPAFTVNQDVMVVSKEVWDTAYHPFGIKPLAYVLSVEDIINGKPYPRCHKLFAKDFPDYLDGDLIPVIHYGDTAGRTFLFQGRKYSGVTIYSFKNPTNWKNFSTIKTTSTIISQYGAEVVDSNLTIYIPNRFFFPPVFRNGKIYYTWANKLKSGGKKFLRINLFRLPLKNLPLNPIASRMSSDGYLVSFLPTQFTDYDPTDIISCEVPAITVNKDGHMVILWCRAEIETNQPLYPEARYTVYYSDHRGKTNSKLLQKGYAYAIDPDTSKKIRPTDRLDYQTVVIDPSDNLTVWMASEYTNKDGDYKMVVGRAKP